MIIWHALSDVYVTKDDIKVLDVDGPARRITFEITPSHPSADIPTIETRLKESIADPDSDLRELLPALDPQLSTVVAEDVVTMVPADAAGEVHLQPTPQPGANAGTAETLTKAGVPADQVAPGKAARPAEPGPSGADWEKIKGGPTVPMSTSMRCIVILTVQYFAVMTLVEFVRTANRVGKDRFATAYKVIQSGVATVKLAPMLAILFLGTRMRASQLGVEPQPFAQRAMEAATYSVGAKTLVAMLKELVGAMTSGGVKTVLLVIDYLIIIGIYGGAATVVYAVLVIEADPAKYPDGPPPVAPAMAATINLLAQYFIVGLLHQIASSFVFLEVGPKETWKKAEMIFKVAMMTVAFAPMLAVLFIGTRMRALQIDPMAGPDSDSGVPQPYAQQCFYICAYAVLGQTILAALIPVVGGGRAKEGDMEGSVEFEIDKPAVASVVAVLRFALMVAMYGATGAIVYANLTMRHANGSEPPPLSPAMQNVTILVTQFFAVHIVIWALTTARDLMKVDMPRVLKTAMQTVETVDFAPMLSVLFLGARMRALELTQGLGQPQGWVQEAMFLSTFALLLKLLVIVVLGAVGDNTAVLAVVEVLNYVITFMLYTGIVTVCLGVMIMEPEVLDGTGGYVWLKM
jgi:hypothetical protein